MSLRMGGLFIQAQVENGAGTFSLGANNSFANSLDSISVTMRSGGASEIEVGLSPTFNDAVQLIESGFLGYGFPIQNQSNPPTNSLLTGGLVQRVSGQTPPAGKAAGISVRFGYGDLGGVDGQAITPWISGNIMSPDLSFGEEISVTLKGVSLGAKLTSNSTTRSFEGDTLYAIVNQLIDEDIKGSVVWDPQARTRAQGINVNGNQYDNTYSFLKDMLERYNFRFFENGGTASSPFQQFVVTDLSSISNKSAEFDIVMYGQIDVPNRVYPAESFTSNIDHTLVTGKFHGTKVTRTETKSKQTSRSEAGVKTYSETLKTQGNTVQGQQKEARPVTSGGNTDGRASLRDQSAAGDRLVTVKKNADDNFDEEQVKSSTHTAMDSAYQTTVTCPLIPEALPNTMVRFTVFTGNPNMPIFTTVSGLYKIFEVRHSVGDNGGTTELVLHRAMGDSAIDAEGVGKSSNVVVSDITSSPTQNSNLVAGLVTPSRLG